MGPSCKGRKPKTSRKSSRPLNKSQPSKSTHNDPMMENNGDDHEEVVDDDVCSTPKAERFRIPEIHTCPPAPMKKRRRIVSSCSLRRTPPIAFFAPPDLELFFYFALRGISV